MKLTQAVPCRATRGKSSDSRQRHLCQQYSPSLLNECASLLAARRQLKEKREQQEFIDNVIAEKQQQCQQAPPQLRRRKPSKTQLSDARVADVAGYHHSIPSSSISSNNNKVAILYFGRNLEQCQQAPPASPPSRPPARRSARRSARGFDPPLVCTWPLRAPDLRSGECSECKFSD